MFWIISGGLWMLLLCTLGRGLWLARRPVGRPEAGLWLALLVGGALFLGRPHEDILGATDPGAYLNSAATFGRLGALSHVEPLLADVPREVRPVFYYGHSGFFATRDVCLRVSDVSTARFGPYFQPAYSMMMSVAARLAGGPAILWVTPLLAWLAALALALLAARVLTWRGAPAWAFAIFILNPVMAWNGRCVRAETAALVFLLAGWALLLTAWTRRETAAGYWRDGLLGLLCLSAAPFFHITAWYIVLPTWGLVLAAAVRTGRPALLAVIPFGAVCPTLFMLQVRYVTDCYRIWRFVVAAGSHPALLSGAAAAALAISAAVAGWTWRMRRSVTPPRPAANWWWALCCAGGLGLILASYAARLNTGQLPFFSAYSSAYFCLADLRGLIRLIAWPAALAGLAGWILLWLHRDPARTSRTLVLAAFLPALLMTGWMYDYMMETRRLMLGAVPLLALCLAGAVAWAGSAGGAWRRTIAVAAGIAVLACGLWNKPALATQIDYRGFTRFLGGVAREINSVNGMALVEYSRLGAPLEHIYGVPLLSLDNENHGDYRIAEAAWEIVLRRHPDRPAFYLTPFQPPHSLRFTFEPVRDFAYNCRLLPSARERVPLQTEAWTLALTLYRMRLRDAPSVSSVKSVTSATAATGWWPAVIPMGVGNMGLTGFANLRSERPEVAVTELAAGATATGRPPAAVSGAEGRPARAVILIAATLGGAPFLVPDVNDATGGVCRTSWRPLDKVWWIGQTAMPDDGAEAVTLTVRARGALALAAGFTVATDSCTRLTWQGGHTGKFTQPLPVPCRWARTEAAAVAPLPRDGGYGVALLAGPGAARAVTLNVAGTALDVAPRDWNWVAWPMPAAETAGERLLNLTTTPPWDPALRGYPRDLGVLVRLIALAGWGESGQPDDHR